MGVVTAAVFSGPAGGEIGILTAWDTGAWDPFSVMVKSLWLAGAMLGRAVGMCVGEAELSSIQCDLPLKSS